MEKLCIVCGKGTTNSQNGICVICTLFDKERVAEYLKNNQVEKGARPENTKKSTSYIMDWQQKPDTETRKSAITRQQARKKGMRQPKPLNWLSRAESLIADRLDASGESDIILKNLA